MKLPQFEVEPIEFYQGLEMSLFEKEKDDIRYEKQQNRQCANHNGKNREII